MPKTSNILAELPRPETVDPALLARSISSGETDLVTVLGPTASGKTKYAVRLARELDSLLPGNARCEIISADSRQVFRGMDIGTGKDISEYGDVPYHLIDIADPGERFNVFEFQKAFIEAFASIRSRGCFPILCGGTGLYINAVTAGYDFSSSKPLSAEGKAHSERPSGLPERPFFIGTLVSREVRNARIDTRLDARLEEGMVDEIRGLLDSGVSSETLLGYGLEYRFVTQYVLGEMGFDEMRQKLATAIHQFAKRQMTWFRGMERAGCVIHWVEV